MAILKSIVHTVSHYGQILAKPNEGKICKNYEAVY